MLTDYNYIIDVDNTDLREVLKKYGNVQGELNIAKQHMLFMNIKHTNVHHLFNITGVLKVREA